MFKIFKKFIDFNSSDPKVNQRSKNNIFYLFLFFVVIFLFMILWSSSNKKNLKVVQDKSTKNKIDFANSININAEDVWLNKSENEIESLFKENKSLREDIENLKETLKIDKEQSFKLINELILKINNSSKNVNNNYSANQNFNEYGELIPKINRKIETISVNLEEDLKGDNISIYNDLENYIPAGSFVIAKMTSGADVSTGVNNQSDPNNMRFEIISPAYTTKYKGQRQEIKKVEGCILLGSATGQLWTEKAYIRLLKMTCSFEKGKSIEFDVRGYVTSFAKEGVRGVVVSREGYFTSMAFLSGAIEGIADVTEAIYSPTLEISSGVATENISGSNVLKKAGASGLGKSAEMLSDYYIKRAEQYQSVIDVPTGIEVEIVFQQGVDLSVNKSFKINNVVKNSSDNILNYTDLNNLNKNKEVQNVF